MARPRLPRPLPGALEERYGSWTSRFKGTDQKPTALATELALAGGRSTPPALLFLLEPALEPALLPAWLPALLPALLAARLPPRLHGSAVFFGEGLAVLRNEPGRDPAAADPAAGLVGLMLAVLAVNIFFHSLRSTPPLWSESHASKDPAPKACSHSHLSMIPSGERRESGPQ